MRLLQILIGVVFVIYPVAVYFSLTYLEPGVIAAILAGLVGLRLLLSGEAAGIDLHAARALLVPVVIVVCLVVVFVNELIVVKFYPVLVSATLLGYFLYTLARPPSAIERVARLSEPDLPASGVRYTRKVTMAWCIFFLVNGSVALWTALAGTMLQWTVYNGFISYVLIGLMFAIEYPIRIVYRRAHS